MLRTCLSHGRTSYPRPIVKAAAGSWHAARVPQPLFQRPFADSKGANEDTKSSIKDAKAPVLPGTSSTTATNPQPPPVGKVFASPVTPITDTSIQPENVPRVPPAAETSKTETASPSSIPPGSSPSSNHPQPISNTTLKSPPPPSPKKKTGRFRRFVLYSILATGIGFGGGTYYSLVSDNFHDFFTEYVPFGEDAVLYFEEREYRKRFPNITNPTNRPVVEENKVFIPSQSGVSVRMSDQSNEGGGQNKLTPSSAKDEKKPVPIAEPKSIPEEKPKSAEPVKKSSSSSRSKEKSRKKREKPSQGSSAQSQPVAQPQSNTSVPREATKAADTSFRPPEVDEPNQIMPIAPIDPLRIKNADEPLVQDLVKILNDIITVVNDDSAAYKYGSTIYKAKMALANVGARILELKFSGQEAAADAIRAKESEFDAGARDLLARLQEEFTAAEGQWRDEFDAERTKLADSYTQRLDTELAHAKEVMDQQKRNELLQQAIALKSRFLDEVTQRVETERQGRLSKLSDLSTSVTELETLTGQWNAVVDANLRAQHLQVAVEAVRSALEKADRPRPFVQELAALKEVAGKQDSLISAAIASIDPSAYQRGIPTLPQLIDRFRRVAGEVRKAALLPEDAGVASHAASYLLSSFLFKKRGMAVGDDVESVLTRTETLLEEGRLEEAVREMNALEGWAKTLSWDWVREGRRVCEVRQAVEVCAAEARLEGLRVDV